MPLPIEQIRFINNNARGKTVKEIRDMIGFFYKVRIWRFIRKKKEPKSMKEILSLKENK